MSSSCALGSIWLRRMGRPVVYTLVPMIFVGLATIVAMLGEVQGYWANFSDQWLLAVSGSTILLLDVWVLGEGFRLLWSEPATERSAQAMEG